MTVYTQSITYETTPDNPAKYPVEVVIEGSGDCDDKSLLLAELLSHEGYKVLSFHLILNPIWPLGLGLTICHIKIQAILYIETTEVSFVGVPPDTLRGGITLTSDPLVIPIGNGTKTYHSGKQVAVHPGRV